MEHREGLLWPTDAIINQGGGAAHKWVITTNQEMAMPGLGNHFRVDKTISNAAIVRCLCCSCWCQTTGSSSNTRETVAGWGRMHISNYTDCMRLSLVWSLQETQEWLAIRARDAQMVADHRETFMDTRTGCAVHETRILRKRLSLFPIISLEIECFCPLLHYLTYLTIFCPGTQSYLLRSDHLMGKEDLIIY